MTQAHAHACAHQKQRLQAISTAYADAIANGIQCALTVCEQNREEKRERAVLFPEGADVELFLTLSP